MISLQSVAQYIMAATCIYTTGMESRDGFKCQGQMTNSLRPHITLNDVSKIRVFILSTNVIKKHYPVFTCFLKLYFICNMANIIRV